MTIGEILYSLGYELILYYAVNGIDSYFVSPIADRISNKFRNRVSQQSIDSGQNNIEMLMSDIRSLGSSIDQVRHPGFTGCLCSSGRCNQFQCGQHFRKLTLLEAVSNLDAQISHIPFSNTLAHQYIKNIKIQVAELLTGIDKYASGTRNQDVLAINYQIDELDAFQQRFKDSIIGLENCLA